MMHGINEPWEMNKDRLALMRRMISTSPKILSESAGRRTCCIYKVAQGLVDINGQAYRPQHVSIGPYHHGHPQFKVMEEHKWRYLKLLLERTQSKGLSLEDLLKAVQPLEASARDCYSENLNFDSDKLIEILVLDGCFIIEFISRVRGSIPFEADDPLLTITSIGSFFLRDLIRIENQIPFFILDCLFRLIQGTDSDILALLTPYFNKNVFCPQWGYATNSNLQGMHILDILRSSFIPPEEIGANREINEVINTHAIHRILRIMKRPEGIGAINILEPINTHAIRRISRMKRIRPGNGASFLSIKFNKGVIEWPTIDLDDFMTSFLLNCVAYEQSHGGRSKHMTTYAILLDCLIVTTGDVEYLSEHNIIVNYFGTNNEVVRFVNNMAKGVVLDIDKCYLASFFDEVAVFARDSWRFRWLNFLYPYFNTPWSSISAVAAFTLLVLTLLQTIFTILSFVNPRN